MPSPTPAASATPTRARSVIYIDGYNLFHGALSGSSERWLNLERYFTLLRQNDSIQRIHYFTARMSSANQDTYLRALSTLPLVNIVEGKFKPKEVTCRVSGCTYPGMRTIRTTIEKRTDVNMALQMLDDAYQSVCEVMVLVTGDSDLVPVVDMIRLRFPAKKVIVYVPARDARRGAAVELRTAAHIDRTLPLELLRKSQFPATVPDGLGGAILKPVGW